MESLQAWKTLQAVKGLGNGALSRLVLRFGSPEAVQSASVHDLTADGGVSLSVAKRIQERPDPQFLKDIDRERQAFDKGKFSIMTILDPMYPPRLRMIPDPPPLLYVTGKIQEADHHALAIVGSRKGTQSGWTVTRQLSGNLAALGFTIVSGLARGIDGAAHQGAIGAGGRTIAVLGCGIDRTYPPEHRKLRQQIEDHGAVFSEFRPGTVPRGYYFPQRNRVISGMCLGVVVTEAAAHSGSLITARLASEQNREVFAVPGAVPNPMSRGPHRLIRQGAKLVEGPDDILEELLPQLESPLRDRIGSHVSQLAPQAPQLGQEEQVLYNFISFEPISVEDLISQGSFAPGEVMSILVSLELKGFVRRLPGAQYVRASIP